MEFSLYFHYKEEKEYSHPFQNIVNKILHIFTMLILSAVREWWKKKRK